MSEPMTDEEVNLLRDVIGLCALPPEPSRLSGSMAARVRELLRSVGPLWTLQVARIVGRSPGQVTNILKRESAASRVVKVDGFWRLA